MNDNEETGAKIEPCPKCGHNGPHNVHYYWGKPQRIACGQCGRAIRTFIRVTDFILIAIILSVIIFWLIFSK